MSDIKKVYSYFSHNFRTSISTIIATVEAVRLDLIDVNSDEMNSVYESAYLLDLFDICLNICINYLADEKVDTDVAEIEPVSYVQHLLNEFAGYVEENDMSIQMDAEPFRTTTNEFTVKNLVQLLTSEMIRLSPSGMTISNDGPSIVFVANESFVELPEIFETFGVILAACGVEFIYSSEEARLNFK